uniref:SPRY-associated domain-containing protein n=1 Tax=Astyanax mexicanus TaxID=7994 RepID=A0A3B1KCL9_ASTMX
KLTAGLKSSHCKVQILRSGFLSVFSIPDESDIHYAANLNTIQNVLYLCRLSGCMITNTGCASLYSALRLNSSNLKELDLTYNHLEESGVKLLNARQEYPRCTPRYGQLGGVINFVFVLFLFTLDPNTAHTRLSLSEGNRKVECKLSNNILSSLCFPKCCFEICMLHLKHYWGTVHIIGKGDCKYQKNITVSLENSKSLLNSCCRFSGAATYSSVLNLEPCMDLHVRK